MDYTSISLETSLMTLQEFSDEDFEETWPEIIAKLEKSASKLESHVSPDEEYEFVMGFADLAGIIQKIALYVGVPPGAFPSSGNEFAGISLAFRRMINTLSRISISHSIGSMIRHQSVGSLEEPDQAADSDKLKSAIQQLVTYAKDLIFQTRSKIQEENSLNDSFEANETGEMKLPEKIEIPLSKFDVKYFVDGLWTNIVVNRSGQLVPQDSSIPGSLTLLEQKFASSRSSTSQEPTNRLRMPLETYNTSLAVDTEVISVLEMRIKTVKNILNQFVKLSNTASSTKSLDATQDRRKILGSSLQALINVSKVIVNIIESIDLTAFYACRASVAESHSSMTRLFAFLEAKQAIYDALAELEVVRNQNEAGDSNFIAALAEKFEKSKLEEIYFTYEQTNEQQIKEKVFKLDAVLASVVESAKNLSTELRSIVAVDSRLLDTTGTSSFPRELAAAAAAAAAVAVSSTAGGNSSNGAMSPRSTYSAKRKESAVDSFSIGSHSIREDGPWFLQLEHGDEIVYDKKGSSIRGGSQRALVEQLTLHSRLNSEFNVAMLLTFQSFMDATNLFEQLVERFLIQPPEGLTSEEFALWAEKKQRPTRLRVVNILKTWLENYWFEDDSEDLTSEARSSLFESMSKFAEQLKAQKFPGGASLYNIVEKRMNDKEPSFKRMIVTTTTQPPPPILPRNLKKFKLTEIDPVEMARQLSVREFKLLVVITSHECLLRGCGGLGKSSNSGGRKIGEFIRNSNCLTNWVAYAILRHSEAKRRASTIRYFIHVAEACRALNNFSSMTAIISALYSSTIHRMKKTWDYVSSKNTAKLENMNRLMNSSRNFNEYRDLLNLVPPPAVPFFGVYLTDLTFVEDGNPDYLDTEHKIVNFAKRQKTATIIENIRQFQIVPYNFEELADVQLFLDRGFEEAPPIEEQYDTSLNFEPREKPGTDKVAKLFEENGIL
ncbi:Ras family guanine nucleotide exchange factor CDC25 [Sugiyamaella lignohabitans]|uniref:Ras family guanine nucleotide exchange factor CDC25 n=1 Tax=Sugiyamaella lignohabitans TaxID=796027 RepID=A0A161HLY5_9ASCO|nr:Ras family guanine nucleotide exchange factor CDC25 [Sugiyamaella lignohabitans]ANB14527.1 Ras family guanine nucleotide exchange factor CDC25 [Sugiyamaella lignohabitans]